MARLIGPRGAYVRDIREKTKASITLPEKEDKGNKKVSIVGEPEQVAAAVAAINQLMSKGFSDLTHPNHVETGITFPTAMIGILKGPRGETIQAIEKSTGTRINVPDKDESNKGMALLTLSVSGPAEGVETARQAILTIQHDHITREIDFPAHLVATLKGAGGANISRISKLSNARIDVGDHFWDPSLKTVSISGFSKNIAIVEQELAVLMQTHVMWTMDFPVDRLGTLFSNGGKVIRELQDKSGARINVKEHEWDDLVKDLTVVGPKAGVDQARVEIERMAQPPPKKVEAAPEAVAPVADEES